MANVTRAQHYIVDPVRESIKQKLPSCMQSFFTELTGKPFVGETPWSRSPQYYLWTACFGMCCGIVFGICALKAGFIPSVVGVPLAWLLITHGLRKLYLTVEHAASHAVVLGSKKADDVIGEFCSLLTWTAPFAQYKERHLKQHHSIMLLQEGESNFHYLMSKIGFSSEQTVEQMWVHLWCTLLNPCYYVKALVQRLSVCFCSHDAGHNARACVWWTMTFLFANYFGCLGVLLICVLPPLVIFLKQRLCFGFV